MLIGPSRWAPTSILKIDAVTTITRQPIVSPLLSIREAAAYLNIGFSSIYEKMGTDLQAVKIGRRRFILRESCDALIARGIEPMNPRASRRRRAA